MLNISLLDKCSKLFCSPFKICPAERKELARGQGGAGDMTNNLPALQCPPELGFLVSRKGQAYLVLAVAVGDGELGSRALCLPSVRHAQSKQLPHDRKQTS